MQSLSHKRDKKLESTSRKSFTPIRHDSIDEAGGILSGNEQELNLMAQSAGIALYHNFVESELIYQHSIV